MVLSDSSSSWPGRGDQGAPQHYSSLNSDFTVNLTNHLTVHSVDHDQIE
jgi:hypothetical protein